VNRSTRPGRWSLPAGWLAGLAIFCGLGGVTVVAFAAAPVEVGLEQPDRTQVASPPVPIRPFELTNQDARPFRLGDLKSPATLVFFGFTNCPNVCPPTVQKMRQVQRALEEQKLPIECLFVSVDGERDTPPVLKKFLAPFGPAFIGVTGDAAVVRDIATEFSAVFFKGMPTDAVGGYNVEHTSQVYLLDRKGRLHATFYNAPAGDMVAVTRELIRDR
jgi:protein SCO1/2